MVDSASPSNASRDTQTAPPSPASGKRRGSAAAIMANSTSKSDSACRTRPRSLRHAAPTGAAPLDTASAMRHARPGRHSVEGGSNVPPSSPLAGRRRISTAPSPGRDTQNAAAKRFGFGARFGPSASVSATPAARAAQASATGQAPQRGRPLGMQMVAPRSISACAWSPGRACGARDAARRRSSALRRDAGEPVSQPRAKSRATTRSMFPSTGAADPPRPKPMARTAAAV